MGMALAGAPAFFREVWPRTARVTVDAVFFQRMAGVEDAFNRLVAILLLAFGDVIAGEAEVVHDAVGIGPLPVEIIVLEEMIVAETGMRDDQRLHGHGV